MLFASRPGMRLWKANTQGVVETTILLKSFLQGHSKDIQVLSDTVQISQDLKVEHQLGGLWIYQGTNLVSHHNSGLYVIDPGLGCILAYHVDLGQILDVSVNDEEIFVLRAGHDTGRPIIRLAKNADLRLGKWCLQIMLQLIS